MAHKLCGMLDKIEEKMSSAIDAGIDTVDTMEFGAVSDIYKDLMCAKKDYYESKYYESLVGAMEDADADEIMDMYDKYNADSRRGYNSRRYANGQYAPKGKGHYAGYTEPMDMNRDMSRDMDRAYGKMYYTEPMHRDWREGKAGDARRGYMETKDIHKGGTSEDKKANMESLENYLTKLQGDIEEMTQNMDSAEKTMLKTKMISTAQRIV